MTIGNASLQWWGPHAKAPARTAMVTMIDPKNIQNPCIRRVMALPRRRCCSRSCKLPEELRRSLTWDQGKEMHAHKRFTVATNVQVNSVIRAVPGSAAQTRTPTACCGSTSREEPISRASLRVILTQLLCGSINVRERPWASKRQPIDCKRYCTDRLNPQV